VIICSVGGALILLGFVAYLIRSCIQKRRRVQKQFNETNFDKVVPGDRSPRKLTFRNVMSRLTFGPRTPATPNTPGTARFKNFPFAPFGSGSKSNGKPAATDEDSESIASGRTGSTVPEKEVLAMVSR